MTEFLTNSLGEEVAMVVSVILALAIVLLLILFVLFLAKQIIGARESNNGGARAQRLQVMDAASVDGKRRVVLVRRDNVEHLVMIGGPNDLVIEPRIVVNSDPRARKKNAGLQATNAIKGPQANTLQSATNNIGSAAAGMMAGAAAVSSSTLNKLRRNEAEIQDADLIAKPSADYQENAVEADVLSSPTTSEQIAEMVANEPLPEVLTEDKINIDEYDIELDMSDFEQTISEELGEEVASVEKSEIEDEMENLLSELSADHKI